MSLWDAERHHDLRVDDVTSPGGPQLKAIRLVGDIVEISEEATPSIIRPSDAPADNVRSLTFDARRIDVKGMLALSNGKVRFIGREVTLFETASVQTTRDPADDQAELSITAVDLYIQGDEFSKPLSIYQDAKGKLPKLKVLARNVYADGALVPEDVASARIWALVGASDEVDQPTDGSVDIRTGAAADADIAAVFAAEAMWPAEVYAKALRLHTGKPFDCGIQAAILKYAQETKGVLAMSSLTEAAAGFPLLAARVVSNLDAFGHGPNWAPRKSLDKQRRGFQEPRERVQHRHPTRRPYRSHRH